MMTEMGTKSDSQVVSLTSLAQGSTRRTTVCMIFSILVNTGLLVYSHIGVNAHVYSTLNLGSDTAPGVVDASGQCAGQNDTAVWIGSLSLNTTDRCNVWDKVDLRDCPYENTPAAREAFVDFLIGYKLCLFTSSCSQSLSGSNPEEKFQSIVKAEWGFSEPCVTCFNSLADCVLSGCTATCAPVLVNKGCPKESDDSCTTCIENSCKPAFVKCSGLNVPTLQNYEFRNCETDSTSSGTPGTESSQQPECFSLEKIGGDMYEIFQIRFANAVTKAWEGGAQALSILVALASGVWPYTKNLIMLWAWFRPMTPEKRESVLVWLSRLGRWSLVDVFAVILIIVGVKMDKEMLGGIYLVVRSSSSAAIYCFAVAAIWALLQGEYIRHLNRTKYPNVGVGSDGKKNSSRARLALLVSSLLALSLALAGAFLVNIEITMHGIATEFNGPNGYNYTGFEIGTSMVDSCQLQYPGDYFLMVLYFATVYFCLFVTLLGYTVMALSPASIINGRPSIVRFLNVCSNFQCLDVFLLSMLVLIAQFKPLIDGSIGNEVDSLCNIKPEDETSVCLEFSGTLKIGAILSAVAAVIVWIAQYLSVVVQKDYMIYTPKQNGLARDDSEWH